MHEMAKLFDMIDTSVINPCDIRGVYPDPLSARFAWLLGRSAACVLGCRRVVVGRDGRHGGVDLAAALVAGLTAEGVEVQFLGLCTSEHVYYAAGEEGIDAGFMVTASHNPAEYNGFKIVLGTGEPVTAQNGMDAIARRMCEADADIPAVPPLPREPGSVVADSYLEFALDLVGQPDVRGVQVVVDAGNGVASLLWDGLADALGLRLHRLNWQPDGDFPSHGPDPTKPENLTEAVQAVVARGADIGFVHDGDADRVVTVLRDGHVMGGAETIACLARHQPIPPGGLFGVVQTVSRRTLEFLAGCGVEPMLLPVGHSKVSALMHADPRIAFAGEDSGHYYYRDFHCCDSALITILHMLHLLAGGALEATVQSMPGGWVQDARPPRFPAANREIALGMCRRVAEAMLIREPDCTEIICEADSRILRGCTPEDIAASDGVRVDYADWWFCVRPSGTEAVARLTVEARSQEQVSARTAELSQMFGGSQSHNSRRG
jgi:phosphomannomutase